MGNLSINSYNIFQAVSSGVNVYDNSGVYAGLVDLPNTSSVWADDTYLYIGTTNSGIYVALASGILSNPLIQYKYDSDITNNDVIYMHGAGEYLCATTISGVDQYNVVSGTRIYTMVSGTNKCYQTSTGEFYYSLNNELMAVYSIMSNWSEPDYIYDTLPFVTEINDIYVTEGTSLYGGDNVIFLGTDYGVHVIEERKGNESSSRTKRFYLK